MKQLSWFGVVGLLALVVHWCVVALIVPWGIAPLLANPIGFLVAFQVSYAGHRRLTFDSAHLPHRQTLPRFFMVALASFLLNQLLYALLLRFSPLGYRQAMFLVLVVVAGITFATSKRWAFR